MTDNHRTDLVYGHLGESRYVPELKKWEFARIPEQRYKLKQIGSSKIALPGAAGDQDSSPIHLAASRDREIKLLQASDAFLSPIAPHLAPLAQVSEHVIDSAAAYDPQVGSLLAFGRAKFEEPHPGTKFVEIAAVATGSRGENVQLVRLTKKRIRSSVSEDIVFDVPTLEGNESALWMGPGSPIQQICFSVGMGRAGTLLAVRTLRGVVIFRPMIRHIPVPVTSFHGSSHPNRSQSASRLDPCPIITISLLDVANVPFSDVTFNPWFDEQFGIVDQHGQWSVFEIDRELDVKRLFLYKAKSDKNHRASEDVWGKIFWAADVTTIVLMQRHSLNVLDVKSGRSIASPAIQKHVSTDKILDVTRDLRNHSMLYVLTTKKVLWVEVQPISDDLKEHHADTRILISFWHYRSFNDPSLRLSISEREDAILILIWSQLATLVTTSTLRRSSDGGTHHTYLDTYDFITDSSFTLEDHETSPQHARLKSMQLQNVAPTLGPAAQFFSRKPPIEISHLFTLKPNMAVSEGLYQYLLSREHPIKLVDGITPGQTKLNLKSSTKVQDSFLVPDALCSEDEGSANTIGRVWPIIKSKESRSGTAGDIFTFSNEWIKRFLNRKDIESITISASKGLELGSHLIESLEDFAVNYNNGSGPSTSLLMDIFGEHLTVSDLDNASQLLRQFLPSSMKTGFFDDESTERLESLSLKAVNFNVDSLSNIALRNDRGTNDITLVSTYDSLVRQWVASLAPRTSSRSRVHLNKMLRITALQIYLSVQGIEKIVHDPQPEPELPHMGAIGKAVEFPALAVRSKTDFTPYPDEPLKGQHDVKGLDQFTLLSSPTLPETSLPSPAPTSAATSQRSMSIEIAIPSVAYTRLSVLAPLDFQPALHDTRQRLSSHWESGTHPSAYDWAAKIEILDRAEQDAQYVDDPDALKQRRRKERRKKRQVESSQRATASSQQQPLSFSTSLVPETMIGSDPISRPNLVDSSQQPPRAILFTQEEPGRFGGRPEMRKPSRPARRQGF